MTPDYFLCITKLDFLIFILGFALGLYLLNRARRRESQSSRQDRP